MLAFLWLRVVAAVGFIRINRIIQLQIRERELLPNGRLNLDAENASWQTSKEFSLDNGEEGVDFHTVSWFNRSIDLDTLADGGRVVTGVRLRVINSHLRLEIQVTHFNYQTGRLDIERSEWLSNNSTSRKPLDLHYPDRSTRSKEKSMPIRGNNYYVNFQATDILKDAAQSIVPFIDGTAVESQTPLAGVGLYYKTQHGYGGFIAPKLIAFDASLHMKPINNFWTCLRKINVTFGCCFFLQNSSIFFRLALIRVTIAFLFELPRLSPRTVLNMSARFEPCAVTTWVVFL